MLVERDDDMGSHLVQQKEQPKLAGAGAQSAAGEQSEAGSTVEGSSVVSQAQQMVVLNDFAASHPSMHLSRQTTGEVERQNINVNAEYGD